jgi:type IV secretory pathway VirB4 component
MSGTNKQPTARRPASLVDSQLQHLENVMQYVTRGDASSGLHSLDHEYWENRIRALEDTYELIAAQRQRVAKLLERLSRDARIAIKPRTAA